MLRHAPLLVLLVLCWSAGAVEVRREVVPATGLERVEAVHPGFTLALQPVTRDYLVAVFLGRGLPKPVAEATRDYCGFGVTVRNTGQRPIRVRLTEWRFVTPDGRAHRVRPKSDWVAQWRQRGIPFRWLLLHEDHTYAPGDWMQGFITVPLPPGARFDLHYAWIEGETRHEGKIEGLRCAPEASPDG
jgi:hypothetical protein